MKIGARNGQMLLAVQALPASWARCPDCNTKTSISKTEERCSGQGTETHRDPRPLLCFTALTGVAASLGLIFASHSRCRSFLSCSTSSDDKPACWPSGRFSERSMASTL